MVDAGAAVVLADLDGAGLARTAERIGPRGGRSRTLVVDVTEERAAQRIVELALEAFGRLDIVVPAAGIAYLSSFEEYPTEQLDRQWAVNVRAPFLLAQAALPHLRGHGSIVFIASIAGAVGFPRLSAYTASKGAIWGLTRALAGELASEGVRVNAIAPGTFDTPQNTEMLADEAFKRALIEAIPAKRLGEVEDIVLPALFLASDGARHVHGVVLTVDGGFTAM
jgi:glucose 1-dehydrogenase